MAETGHNGEEHRATTRDCPCRKLSVLDDLRLRSMCCGQARLGEKITQSVVRLNWELILHAPWNVNLVQQRKAKKARVNAAQIIEKSQTSNQLSRTGRIANRTRGCPADDLHKNNPGNEECPLKSFLTAACPVRGHCNLKLYVDS